MSILKYTSESKSRTPRGISITVRKRRFDLGPDLPRFYFAGSPWKTHLANALSITFPSAEDCFIMDGVRPYLQAVNCPTLEAEARRFIGQESFHSREHDRFNQVLTQRYPGLVKIEALEAKSFRAIAARLPHRFRLALAASFEHMTASFANFTLAYPDNFEGMEPEVRALFEWHAREEIEHKSVAFDVHNAMGGSHLTRIAALVLGASLMAPPIAFNLLYLAYVDGILLNGALLKDFKRVRREDAARSGSPSILGLMLSEVLPFFKPTFHPWDRDDRQLLNPKPAPDSASPLSCP